MLRKYAPPTWTDADRRLLDMRIATVTRRLRGALEADESVRFVVFGRTGLRDGWRGPTAWLLLRALVAGGTRTIVATDRRVLAFANTSAKLTGITGQWALARAPVRWDAPVSGRRTQCLVVGDEEVWPPCREPFARELAELVARAGGERVVPDPAERPDRAESR